MYAIYLGEMNTLAQSSLGSSSARDRTNEFMTTIRSLQGQQLGRNGNFNQQEAPQDRHGQLGKTIILVQDTTCIYMQNLNIA
jgi:hypothetical protein